MVLDIYEALLAAYAAQLGVTATKGYPDWARPGGVLPCVALEIAGWQPTIHRKGEALSWASVGYRGWLFARDEPELARLMDGLAQWHKDLGGAFEVAAQRVASKLQEMQRWEPVTSTQKEAHTQVFVVEVAYPV